MACCPINSGHPVLQLGLPVAATDYKTLVRLLALALQTTVGRASE